MFLYCGSADRERFKKLHFIRVYVCMYSCKLKKGVDENKALYIPIDFISLLYACKNFE